MLHFFLHAKQNSIIRSRHTEINCHLKMLQELFKKYTQKQPPKVFLRKGVLRIFAKFTGKYLCQRLFFNNVAGQACNFIKRETLAQVLLSEFCEISNNSFFTEDFWATASAYCSRCSQIFHLRSFPSFVL